MDFSSHGRIIKIIIPVSAIAMLVLSLSLLLPRSLFSGANQVDFKIEKGQSLASTARLLADKNLIISRYLFVLYVVGTGQQRKFQAGEYLIPKSASIVSLVHMFSTGQAQSNDIVVTIPEGTNLADIDRIFYKAGLTKEGDFLGPQMLKNEGYLFPDTYRFNPDDKPSAAGIVSVLRSNFDSKIKVLGAISDDKLKNAVIVASILEKEVKTEGDMRLVSGIIQKRIAIGMPLEVDAAVAYGVCYSKFEAKKYCDVSAADIVDNIKVDSLYNVYRRLGMPAGPISNPGLQSLFAALNPQSSEYLFYLTDKEGNVIFSKTAAEQEKNRKIYLGL